ncbi:MAG: hypothetical protein M1455_06420 [Actinobacteria bacterium]|nr:hypothetical protein [Actinomycetota bacterium]
MKAYATSAEYTTFSGQVAPADVDRLLDRATELIDNTVTSIFDIDATDGLPTGTLVVQGINVTVASVMRDACCAQVEFWAEVGEENDIDGLAGSQVSVLGYSGRRPPKLSPRAWRILQNAGLV